jgi:hypothetical protein
MNVPTDTVYMGSRTFWEEAGRDRRSEKRREITPVKYLILEILAVKR